MTPCDYQDICAVGSRVYWHDYADSDIDVVAFIPDEYERIANTFHEYEGIKMAISYQPISKRDGLVMGEFKMPQYSLMTGALYDGVEAHYIPCRARHAK